MTKSTPLQKSLLALVATAVTAGLVGVGFYLGQTYSLRNLQEIVADYDRGETMGFLRDEQRSRLSVVYDDPARAEAEMDRYTWGVPNIPTPFVGAAPAPGEYMGTRINATQMRHPTPIQVPKPEGVFRIFVTGGSTAFGTAAPSDLTTIPANLQKIINRELKVPGRRYEVINAANPAWASTHERILIENRLSEMEPDLVVSYSGNNEAHFGHRGLNVLWFRAYAEHHFSRLLSQLLSLVEGNTFPIADVPSGPEPVPVEEMVRRLKKNLRLASTALEGTGAEYVFALQPTLTVTKKPLTPREQATVDPGRRDYFVEFYRQCREELTDLDYEGFHFVDASTAFDDRTSSEEVFLDSFHFGDRGNRLAAEHLYKLLLPFLQ